MTLIGHILTQGEVQGVIETIDQVLANIDILFKLCEDGKVSNYLIN